MRGIHQWGVDSSDKQLTWKSSHTIMSLCKNMSAVVQAVIRVLLHNVSTKCINGPMQDCGISNALVMEIQQCCIESMIWWSTWIALMWDVSCVIGELTKFVEPLSTFGYCLYCRQCYQCTHIRLVLCFDRSLWGVYDIRLFMFSEDDISLSHG